MIKERLKDEFIGFMDANNDDDAPDGAWFAMLECAGEEFIQIHKLKDVDGNDLAHHYLQLKSEVTA